MKLGPCLLVTLSFPLVFGCSSDQTGGLGGTDGAAAADATTAPVDGSAFPDATQPPGDSGVPFDASGPMDGDVPPPPPPDGGMQECRFPQECLRALGRPPACPDGRPGTWACEMNQCIVQCATGPTCANDCDCPFDLSCGQGECLPLNRPNLCCDNPACRPGTRCVEADGTGGICPEAPPPTDGGVPVGDGGVPTTVPVGAACMDPSQCNGGFCLDNTQGFVDGYCTDRCGPQGNNCPVGATCQEFGQRQSFCLDECTSTADCRTGYDCVRLGTAVNRVCFPLPPGSNNPNGDPVGSACASDNDCVQGLTCLQDQGWPGGYCTVPYCDPQTNPCPTASACYAFPGSFSVCLADCPSGGSQSSCRPNYYCFGPTGAPGGCLPN